MILLNINLLLFCCEQQFFFCLNVELPFSYFGSGHLDAVFENEIFESKATVQIIFVQILTYLIIRAHL